MIKPNVIPDKKILVDLFSYIDGCLFWKVSRGNVKKGTRCGTFHPKGYRRLMIDGVFYLEHRIIFKYFHSYCPDVIDHINRDSTDNKIENLRPSSPKENQQNRKLSKINTSGFTGVIWNKLKNKWQSYITVDGKTIYLGIRKDINKAISLRKDAELKYFSANKESLCAKNLNG